MPNQTTSPKTVELWIRSFAPASAGPTQERALDYFEELESQAPIESVEVGVWGKEIERTDRTTRIPQLERIETRIEAFEEWAARSGHRLEPFFRETRIDSMITDESYDVWRLPTVALAEFDSDDELLHVAPCRDGEETIDVFDRFDALLEDDPTLAADEDRQMNEGVSYQPANRVTDFRPTHIEPTSPRSD